MMARIECFTNIPSHSTLAKKQIAQEEDGAEAQVETLKCSSTYLIRRRRWSRWHKHLASFSCGRPRTERWPRSCIFLWGRLHMELILAFASVRRMTQVWRAMTGEERRTNCQYTLLCSDPRRRVAAATRCESSASSTLAPMYVTCV